MGLFHLKGQKSSEKPFTLVDISSRLVKPNPRRTILKQFSVIFFNYEYENTEDCTFFITASGQKLNLVVFIDVATVLYCTVNCIVLIK